MPYGDRAADEAFSVLCPFAGLFLTGTGALIGAVELSGVDPDGMTKADAARLVAMTANIVNTLPVNIALSQYYVHAEGTTVTFRPRPSNPIAERLTKARETAVNTRGLTATRLVHFLEYADPEGWNGGFLSSLLTNLPRVTYDHAARTRLKAMISAPGAMILREEELRERAELLKKAMADYAAKWSLTMDATVLSPTRTWRFMKFLATLDNRYLDDALPIQVPLDDCGLALPAGDIEPIQIRHVDMLKLTGPRPRYVRFAPIIRAPKDPIGSWSLSAEAPLLTRGNYVLIAHFAPLSALQRGIKFRVARNRLERSRIDLGKMISGMSGKNADPAPETEDYGFRRKREELERAEDIEDRFAEYFSQLCIYDEDPEQLLRSCDRLNTAVTSRLFGLTWENAGLPAAYRSFQPGGAATSIRKAMVTTVRASALSLVTKSSTGRQIIPDLGDPALKGEEALYLFETKDGQPFWYSPLVGGRAFVLAVGPTRSGKTYLKNTLTANFLKYGGFAREVDIDAGSETLAAFYGDDAGIVRLAADQDQARGLNPFVSCTGPGDLGFREHMITLALAFLEANDAEEGRSIDQFEQEKFDQAVQATINLPRHMQTLEHFFTHLPRETAVKFARWRRGGQYDGLFNASEDGIGAFDKKLGVFNLYNFRDIPRVLRPTLIELFFRVTRLFESEQHRFLPKMLDIDEAHHALSIPRFADWVVKKARTWAKFNSSITCWTQSPKEYLEVPGWHALRGAATTYFFMADGKMDRGLYQQAFGLSDGYCDAIANLVPRREAFIVQPEIGVAKTVILRTEPEQSVVNTSHPQEVALRTRLMAEYGVQDGLTRTIEALAARAAERAQSEESN